MLTIVAIITVYVLGVVLPLSWFAINLRDDDGPPESPSQ